jgi:hypothetical protein
MPPYPLFQRRFAPPPLAPRLGSRLGQPLPCSQFASFGGRLGTLVVLTGGRVTTESSLDRLALLLPDEVTDPVSSVSADIIRSATTRIAFARSE